jgi:predicted small integral membrane protein
MLGLVQRWGEVFPAWMIGLAGRRVPIALALVPASVISVLFVVAGIGIWSGYQQMAQQAVGSAQDIVIVVGPTLLFPVWGVALAVATLGYYYRRRGPCGVCGRGARQEGPPAAGNP